MKTGFTLVELSIVLVIIGLIIGGVLVGQDLINAATIRSQISQIEKYNTAVNTFVGKYGYLPGDIPDPIASRYGFLSRGPLPGEGDGNGVIEGIYDAPWGGGFTSFTGESATFWVDLSQANLIGGSFSTATPTATPGAIQGAGVANYFPLAKIGNGNYVAVFSGGYAGDGLNYFDVGAFTGNGGSGGWLLGETTITPLQAYNIDSKIDDGLPQRGNVTAVNIGGYGGYWAAGNHGMGASEASGAPVVAGDGVATPASSSTCYDNGNVAGGTEKYSTAYQNGVNSNCALAFQFQ